jgi:hypothetical protein
MVETGEYNVDNYVDIFLPPLWDDPPRDKEDVVGDNEIPTSVHIPTAAAVLR